MFLKSCKHLLSDECLVCLDHFARGSVLHWLNEDGIAVNFGEYHYVLVAMDGFLGKTSCLIGVDLEGCFIMGIIDLPEGILCEGSACCSPLSVV